MSRAWGVLVAALASCDAPTDAPSDPALPGTDPQEAGDACVAPETFTVAAGVEVEVDWSALDGPVEAVEAWDFSMSCDELADRSCEGSLTQADVDTVWLSSMGALDPTLTSVVIRSTEGPGSCTAVLLARDPTSGTGASSVVATVYLQPDETSSVTFVAVE